MNGTRLAWDTALALLAGVFLFTGLARLETAPLLVFIILGEMSLLVFPAAVLCGAAVQDTGQRRNWKSN